MKIALQAMETFERSYERLSKTHTEKEALALANEETRLRFNETELSSKVTE